MKEKLPYAEYFRELIVYKKAESLAEAELNETEPWIETACNCEYLPSRSRDKLINECVNIRRLIGGIILKADSFIKTLK